MSEPLLNVEGVKTYYGNIIALRGLDLPRAFLAYQRMNDLFQPLASPRVGVCMLAHAVPVERALRRDEIAAEPGGDLGNGRAACRRGDGTRAFCRSTLPRRPFRPDESRLSRGPRPPSLGTNPAAAGG